VENIKNAYVKDEEKERVEIEQKVSVERFQGV
jgi:hypothetical protein